MDNIEGRLEFLEHSKIPMLEKDINEIKVNLTENTVLTRQSVENNQKLSDTMDSMKQCMYEMTQSLREGNKISGELTEAVSNLNAKMEETTQKVNAKFERVNNRINEIDEKSKIDIMTWIKRNWFTIIIALGALVYVIKNLIKI